MLSWPPLAIMRSRCGGYSFASRPRDLLPRYATDHNKLGVPCVANQCLYARLGCESVAGRRWWIDPTGERSWWGLRWGWSSPSCCRGAPSTALTDILDRTLTLTKQPAARGLRIRSTELTRGLKVKGKKFGMFDRDQSPGSRG
jgi:hypothetical protein